MISLNVSNLKTKMIYSVSHDLVYAVVGGSVLLRQVFFFIFLPLSVA